MSLANQAVKTLVVARVLEIRRGDGTYVTTLEPELLLTGISGRTVRARIWRGPVDEDAAGGTLAEHEAIYAALADRDAALAQAPALMRITTTERWLREHPERDPTD